MITRRQFVAGAASVPVAGCGLSDVPGSIDPAPVAVEQQLSSFAFTDAQRRTLTAAVSCLIPASGPDDWSAADAGAVEYIEVLLNAFDPGSSPRIYAHGPLRERLAGFQGLSRIKAHGWLQEVLRLREVYAQGLDELNRLARGPLSLLPGDFAALPPAAQEFLLRQQDGAQTPFFNALFTHTMEGVYAHPVYGGNRDYVAWREYCYEGDVHGVRFPGGHDPSADDRPWDQFGGYTPEEIGQPGGTCTRGST